MSTAWLNGSGKVIVDGSGNVILCDSCPCVTDSHLSDCNGTDVVPGALVMTVSFHGHSASVPLDWIVSSSSCIGAEGWEYTGPEITVCSGLTIAGVALCCGLDSAGVWGLSIAVKIAGILDSFATHGGGLNTLTIVSTSPVHYTTQTTTPFSACAALDDLLVDIQPAP